jgi:hypothetical protein
MNSSKPIASLSLDLDNKWSYMKTHGDHGWDSFPSYLDLVVPRVLRFLKERNLTVTFFIVGQDAALEKNRAALAAISSAGHEIGNHSFHHEPWLHLYSEQEIECELSSAEEHIERATGQKPIGFRGPGFSLSRPTLRSLARRGYLYDATTFPTFLGPVARAYYFMTTKLSPEQRLQRKALFGDVWGGLRSLRPYRWQVDSSEIIEIPLTTLPILKLPMHVSYLLYLSTVAPALALSYFRLALTLCRLRGIQPSLLLHPLDFLGSDDTHDLFFFPAMRLPSEKKLAIVGEILRLLSDEFSVVTLHEHALEASRTSGRLAVVEPNFS